MSKLSLSCFLLVLGVALPGSSREASAQSDLPTSPKAHEYTASELEKLNGPELDRAFEQGAANEIPEGNSDGTVVFIPGERLGSGIGGLIWGGKVVDSERGRLVNKVFGAKTIEADVYFDYSWHDRRRVIVVDYAERSLTSHSVRDEIRQVGPHVYLGKMFVRTLFGVIVPAHFILQFTENES